MRGVGLSELLEKGVLRKVYSGLVRVFSQGSDDRLEVRMGNCGMQSQRHKANGQAVPSEGMDSGQWAVGREDK
jgi:hypothetical protein